MSDVKQLPFNKEAEMSVIGAIYLDPEVYANISNDLQPDDFYLAAHQELYTTMGLLSVKGQLDLVTLKAQLMKRGTFDKVGGMEYIVETVNFVPSSFGVKEYVRIIKECSVRRKMIKGYAEASRALYDPQSSVNSITDYVQDKVLGGSEKPKNITCFADAYREFIADLDERRKSGEKFPGIKTGFKDFDRMTGGLESGKLYVIGGRPSMGKSALALNIASHIAYNGKVVLFFSLEMKCNEVIKRVISYMTNIKNGVIKTASITEEERKEMDKAAGRFTDNSLFIEDDSYQTISKITSTCIRLNNQLRQLGKKIDCVMIDHLHLMSTSQHTNDRRFQIGDVSRGCKLLADKIESPVVLLSQLSRATRERKDNRHILSDLRESGDIEQDADVVAFVHREAYYTPTFENQDEAELIVAKCRDGMTGTVKLGWDGATTTFMSMLE